MGCRRSPFLNMGTTLAVVQSVGIIPCFSEAWKNSVNVGVISSASVLSSLLTLACPTMSSPSRCHWRPFGQQGASTVRRRCPRCHRRDLGATPAFLPGSVPRHRPANSQVVVAAAAPKACPDRRG